MPTQAQLDQWGLWTPEQQDNFTKMFGSGDSVVTPAAQDPYVSPLSLGGAGEPSPERVAQRTAARKARRAAANAEPAPVDDDFVQTIDTLTNTETPVGAAPRADTTNFLPPESSITPEQKANLELLGFGDLYGGETKELDVTDPMSWRRRQNAATTLDDLTW
jgi:hypothetical protein